MKTNKAERITALRLRAIKLGSKAETLKGIGKALRGTVRPVWAIAPRSKRGVRRVDGEAAQRTPRLLRRFVGSSARTQRYLSALDKFRVEKSLEQRNYLECMALPLCARAFYASLPLRQLAGKNRQVRRALKAWAAARGTKPTSGEIFAHFSRVAFNQCDWGRLQKRNQGSNKLQPGISTTTNGKWGWDKVSEHYADFTLILPRSRYGIGYFHAPQTKAIRLVCGPSRIIWAGRTLILTAPPSAVGFPVHIQRRLIALHLPAALKCGYDRTAKQITLTDSRGEIYHCPRITTSVQARTEIKKAVTAFRKRRAEKIVLNGNLSQIFVSLPDSLEAGNCESQSRVFAAQVWQEIQAVGECAVRGDVVLAMRDDSYSRRAIAYAATRERQI